MAEYLLLLGSNQGDRAAALARARAELARLPGARLIAVSRIYESAPHPPGPGAGGRYLNQAVKISAPLSPMGLLVQAKRLEAAAGRRPGRRWGPRPLDVDLLECGRLRLKTRWLVLPHPRIKSRAFVLAPLSELSPRWRRFWRLKPPPGTVSIFASGRRHGR